jgi:hypothetical protein
MSSIHAFSRIGDIEERDHAININDREARAITVELNGVRSASQNYFAFLLDVRQCELKNSTT